MLSAGIAREQARILLPVSAFTSFFMTGNLLNWLKFLKLRLADEAQYEVWYIAEHIGHEISNAVPVIWDIVKEEICGTPSSKSESGHVARFISEGGIGLACGETVESASAHCEKVLTEMQGESSGTDQG
jgi:thymidylate synthase (FAD)